jgi:hypothetical protein
MATQVVNFDNFVESDEEDSAKEPAAATLIHTDGRSWPLRAGETIIGRGVTAEISVPDFDSLSGKHLRFGINPETLVCTVTDLGSTNGSSVTFPDGKQLSTW